MQKKRTTNVACVNHTPCVIHIHTAYKNLPNDIMFKQLYSLIIQSIVIQSLVIQSIIIVCVCLIYDHSILDIGSSDLELTLYDSRTGGTRMCVCDSVTLNGTHKPYSVYCSESVESFRSLLCVGKFSFLVLTLRTSKCS